MRRQFLAIVGGVALVGLLALPAVSQQKTVKQCNDEWTANKAAIQASGKTKKAYVAECRGQTAATPAAPAAAPSQPPAPAAPAPKATTPAPKAAAKTSPSPSVGAPAGAGQFATEAQARAHCPADTVVWANLNSKVYHFAGNRDYGNTKSGAYMCERDTTASGFRAAKNEKHP